MLTREDENVQPRKSGNTLIEIFFGKRMKAGRIN